MNAESKETRIKANSLQSTGFIPFCMESELYWALKKAYEKYTGHVFTAENQWTKILKFINRHNDKIPQMKKSNGSPPFLFPSLVNRPKERERDGEFQEVFLKLISQTPRKGNTAGPEK